MNERPSLPRVAWFANKKKGGRICQAADAVNPSQEDDTRRDRLTAQKSFPPRTMPRHLRLLKKSTQTRYGVSQCSHGWTKICNP